MTIDAAVRVGMIALTGGSITANVALAFQAPASPYTASLVGAGCTAMLAMVGLTYKGIVRRLEEVKQQVEVGATTQNLVIQSLFRLESKLHPGAEAIILQELSVLTGQLSESRTMAAKAGR